MTTVLERPIAIHTAGFNPNLAVEIQPSPSLIIDRSTTLKELILMIQQDLDNVEDRANPGGEVTHPAFPGGKISVFTLNKFREFLGQCLPSIRGSTEKGIPLPFEMTLDELSSRYDATAKGHQSGSEKKMKLQLGLEVPLYGPLTMTYLPHPDTPQAFNDFQEKEGTKWGKKEGLPFTEEKMVHFDRDSLWTFEWFAQDRAGHKDCSGTVLLKGSEKILRLGNCSQWSRNNEKVLRDAGITPGSTVVMQQEAPLQLKVEVLGLDGTTSTSTLTMRLPFSKMTGHTLKEQIHAELKIPVSDQCLSFTKAPMLKGDKDEEKRLERDETLASYRLEHLDSVHLQVRSGNMNVLVRFLPPRKNSASIFVTSQKPMSVSVSIRGSVKDLKESIAKSLNVPPESQQLYLCKKESYTEYTETLLEDANNLAEDYDMDEGSHIILLDIREMAWVEVTEEDGSTFSILTHGLQSVAQFKESIAKKFSFPTKDILLSYDYKKQHHEHVAGTVVPTEGTELGLTIIERQVIRNSSDPRDYTINSLKTLVCVNPDTTVRELKRQYAAQSGNPMEEVELQVSKKDHGCSWILTEDRGEVVADHMHHNLTSADTTIQFSEIICKDEIGRLKDRAFMCTYGLPADSTMKLLMKRRQSSGKIPITAKFPLEQDDKKVISLTVDLSDTVKELQKKLAELTGKPASELRVTYSNRFTEENKTLADLWMKPGDEISVMPPLRGGMYTTASGRRDFGVAKPAVVPTKPAFFTYAFKTPEEEKAEEEEEDDKLDESSK